MIFFQFNLKYKDVGVGPLKVLKTKDTEVKKNHSRIVMRREAAHNVIMNMTINKFVKLFRQSTNIIRITCVESTQSSDSNKSEFSIASYLVKTQSNQVIFTAYLLQLNKTNFRFYFYLFRMPINCIK